MLLAPKSKLKMQLLAGIQRPIPTVQTPLLQDIDYKSLCLKTVKLTLVLMKRADMIIFSRSNFEAGSQKRRLALTCGLFMLIRASKMSVSGVIVEKALCTLERLEVLGLWGLGQLVTGGWEIESVINLLDYAVMLKILTEWRLTARGQARLNKPLDVYLAHLIKVPPQIAFSAQKKIIKLDDYELPPENFGEQEQIHRY